MFLEQSKTMIFTNISLKKLIDSPVAGDKVPSHAIVASDDKYEHKTTVGKLWLKEYDGQKYLSGGLNKENRKYTKKEGTEGEEKAYVILTLDEYNKLKSPSVPVGGYTGEVATGEVPVEEIPF